MSYEIHKLTKVGGITVLPATSTDAVLHPQVKKPLTRMITDYNVSVLFPTGGVSGGNVYTLSSAITKLSGVISDSDKVLGVRVSFLDQTGDLEVWEYVSGSFSSTVGWREIDSKKMLEIEKAVFPLSTSFSATPTLIEAGVSTEVSLTWGTTRKGENVTGSTVYTLDSLAVSGTSKKESIVINPAGTKTYTLTATYAGMTDTKTITITSRNKKYSGVVSNGWTVSETNIKALSSYLEINKTHTRSSLTLTNEKVVYAYPKSMGELTSIKDANNFEYLSSYTKTEITVSGVAYLVYILTDPTTVTGFTQKFN